MSARFTKLYKTATFLLVLVCLVTIRVSHRSGGASDEDVGYLAQFVTEVRPWRHGIRYAVWNSSLHFNTFTFTADSYNEDWETLIQMVQAGNTPCTVLDIGANDGDTTLNLAKAANGGKVLAFEMGPSLPMLRYNIMLNPQHAPQIDVHAVAVSDETGRAVVASELELHQVICNCADCCRGIVRAADTDSSESVESVRLVPYLQHHYPPALLASVCLVKLDTEGHDTAILRDLLRSPAFRPPIIWTEWFELFKYIDIPGNMTRMLEDEDYCTPQSKELFQAILQLGYEIFEPGLPLRRVPGCANKHHQDDLLLVSRRTVEKWIADGVRVPETSILYEMELYPR